MKIMAFLLALSLLLCSCGDTQKNSSSKSLSSSEASSFANSSEDPAESSSSEKIQLVHHTYDYFPSDSYDYETFSGWEFGMAPPYTKDELRIAKTYHIPSLDKIANFWFDYSRCLVVGTDKKLYCWGANNGGSIGDGTKIHRYLPYQLSVPSIKSACISSRISWAITEDNLLYCWGENVAGEMGMGTEKVGECFLLPQILSFPKPVEQVHSCGWSVLFRSTDGEVYRTGMKFETIPNTSDYGLQFMQSAPNIKGFHHLSEYGRQQIQPTFELLETPEKAIDIGGFAYNYCFVGESGTVYLKGLLGIPMTNLEHRYEEWTPLPFPEPIRKAVTGGECVIALGESGALYGYGYNYLSILAQEMETDQSGNEIPQWIEKPVLLLEQVKDFSHCSSNIIAVTTQGDCYAWGANSEGALGLGEEALKKGELNIIKKPTKINFPEPIWKVALDETKGFALACSGRLYFWGHNAYNFLLAPGFTPESVKNIPFSDRYGPEWTVFTPQPVGKSGNQELP